MPSLSIRPVSRICRLFSSSKPSSCEACITKVGMLCFCFHGRGCLATYLGQGRRLPLIVIIITICTELTHSVHSCSCHHQHHQNDQIGLRTTICRLDNAPVQVLLLHLLRHAQGTLCYLGNEKSFLSSAGGLGWVGCIVGLGGLPAWVSRPERPKDEVRA